MWADLERSNVTWCRGTAKCVLGTTPRRDIDDAVRAINERIQSWEVQRLLLTNETSRSFMKIHTTTIADIFQHITEIQSTFELVARGCVEIQRLWLEVVAWIDWMTIYRSKINNRDAPGVEGYKFHHLVGAFTKNENVLASLCNAGIPVWFIRSSNDFSNQVILRVEKPRGWEDTLTTKKPFPAPAPILTAAIDDLNIYTVLMRATQSFIGSSTDPFDARYGSETSVNTSVGRSRQLASSSRARPYPTNTPAPGDRHPSERTSKSKSPSKKKSKSSLRYSLPTPRLTSIQLPTQTPRAIHSQSSAES